MTIWVDVQGSILIFNIATIYLLIKFKVVLKSIKATIAKRKPIRKINRQIGLDEK